MTTFHRAEAAAQTEKLPEREILRIQEGERGWDSLEVMAYGNGVTINVDNPLAGSTDSGFGYTCSIRLNWEQVKILQDWLAMNMKGRER